MKYALAIVIFIFPLFVWSACDSESLAPSDESIEGNGDENGDGMKSKITIKVRDKIFTATLEDNATATAFKAMLPLTINMTELNGNKKFFRFSKDLPTNALNPGTLQSGDLMLWGSNTLVLFYETFPTSYRYTRLGKIDNPSGLAAALGSGSITVIFEAQ